MGGILLVVDFGMGLSCIDAIDVILSDWHNTGRVKISHDKSGSSVRVFGSAEVSLVNP